MKLSLHRQHTPAVSLSWKEGKYWDLWMIVHFWSGVVLAFLVPFIDAPKEFILGIAFLCLVAWELIEYFFDIHEVIENRILDIIFGLAGLLLFSNYLIPILERESLVGFGFTGSLIILVILGVLGWKAYRERVEK